MEDIKKNVFTIKYIREPVVLMHRYGGNYGEAKFLITATSLMGNIKVSLMNAWGVNLKVIELKVGE